MVKIFVFLFAFVPFLGLTQVLSPTLTQLNYPNISSSKMQEMIDQGKYKSALETFFSNYQQAVNKENLKFIYQAEESLSFFLNNSFLANDEWQMSFYQFHDLWNKSSGMTKNLLSFQLANILTSNYHIDKFSFDDESMFWPIKGKDITLKNGSIEPLVKLYDEAKWNKSELFTSVPAKAVAKEHNSDFPTLYDLLLAQESNRCEFSRDTTYFFASSEQLEKSTNPFVVLEAKLEQFHLKYGNWDALRFWKGLRLGEASQEIAPLTQIKQYKKIAQEFQNNPNENFFQLKIAALHHSLASSYDFSSNQVVKQENNNALNVIETATKKWPESKFNPELLSLKKEILAPYLGSSFPLEANATVDNLLRFTHRNAKKGYLRLYRLLETPANGFYNGNSIKNWKMTLENSLEFDLEDQNLHLTHSTDVLLPKLKTIGTYVLLLSHANEKLDAYLVSDSISTVSDVECKIFSTTNLLVNYINRNNSYLIQVTDRWTGKPVANAQIKASERDRTKQTLSGSTDKNGQFQLKFPNARFLQVSKGTDSTSLYLYPNNSAARETNTFKMYTDRGIYRPGQKIELEVFSLRRNTYGTQLNKGENLVISARDINGEEIFTTKLSTNKMGSAYTAFVLPNQMVTGQVSISVNNNYWHYIQVEEYKRPTFFIEWNQPKETFRLNSPVKLSGKVLAYAGYPLSNVEVTVDVNEQRFFPRFCIVGWEQMNYDTTFTIKTNEDGIFETTYLSQKPKETSGIYVNFSAQALSPTGESQFAGTSLFLGKEGLYANIEMDAQPFKGENIKATLNLSNSSGTKIEARPFTYELSKKTKEVFSLKQIDPAEYRNFKPAALKKTAPYLVYGREDTARTIVLNGEGNSAAPLVLSTRLFQAGRYLMKMTAKNDLGETVTTEFAFTLIDLDRKKHQHQELLWVVQNKKNYALGETAEIVVASGLKKQTLFYSIEKPNGEFVNKTIKLKGRKTIQIPLDSTTRAGVKVSFFTNRYNEYRMENITLQPKDTTQKLEWKWKAITDLSEPSRTENWEFEIKNAGNLVSGEALIAMYDKALDQFADNSWSIPQERNYWSAADWNINHGQTMNLYLSSYGSYGRVLGNGFGSDRFLPKMESKVLNISAASMKEEVMEFADSDGAETSSKREDKKMPIRSNFSETAFFIPQLKMEKGNARFSFKVPDALTTYQFKGVFHTEKGQFITTTKDLIVQKKLMVESFEPRFFRSGDTLQWTINLRNLTDQVQKATASLVFKNQKGEEITNSLVSNAIQNVELPAKGAKSVSFDLVISGNDNSELTFIIGAETTEMGDFIQKTIPVLPLKQSYTYAESFVVEGPKNEVLTWNFDKKVGPNAKIEEATIHYFADQEVLLFKELTKLFFRKNDLNENVLFQFYAASLAKNLLEKNPTLRAYLQDYISKSDPKSPLENSGVDLSTTTWVEEANTESNQLRSFKLLLDDQALTNFIASAKNDLSGKQLGNGAWSWIGQEYPNRYVTLNFVDLMSQLQERGIQVDEEALKSALTFLSADFEQEYVRLSKENKAKFQGLYLANLRWLLIHQINGLAPTDASNYYKECLVRNWTKLGLENWALAGLYFQKSGQNELANAVFEALEDNKISKQKLGEYWSFSDRTSYQNLSSIDAQLKTIEFYKTQPKGKETKRMEQWVVQQKRASGWEDLQTIAQAADVLLDGKIVAAKEVRIGWVNDQTYVSSLPEEKWVIKNPSRSKVKEGIQIDQKQEITNYIELTAKYDSPISEVQKSNADFRIERQYYLLQKGLEIPIKEVKNVKVGDKIKVVLKIIAPTQMSYLHLTDPRFSGQENTSTISGYNYSSVGYYQSVKDTRTDFFIESMSKGTHQIAYEIVITAAGNIQLPPATIVSYYLPQRKANTEGARWEIK